MFDLSALVVADADPRALGASGRAALLFEGMPGRQVIPSEPHKSNALLVGPKDLLLATGAVSSFLGPVGAFNLTCEHMWSAPLLDEECSVIIDDFRENELVSSNHA
jgi:hypothetical protein